MAQYLVDNVDNVTQIKIQKGLYLLWAYYSATYGQLESAEHYPDYLFEPSFTARRYGPFDTDVYEKFTQGNNLVMSEHKLSFGTASDNNVKKFMDNFISQFNSIDDFGLILRTQEDDSWSSVYIKGQSNLVMNPLDIKRDYLNYVNKD